MKKQETLRQQGERLNKEGRLSPLDVIQRCMEYFGQLAAEEMAKGAEASREKIASHLASAQNAAVELAPYRHPRLQATAVQHSATGDLAELFKAVDGSSRGLRVEKFDDTTTRH